MSNNLPQIANECLFCREPLITIYSGISSSYSRSSKSAIGECPKCTLCQTMPRPTSSDLSEIYSMSYAYDLHEAVYPEKSFRARKLVNMFGQPSAGSTALEIGCGEGILLYYLQTIGVTVFGCEIDKSSCEKANQSLGDERVSNLSAEKYLQNATILPNFVYLSHTLEHFENPLVILQDLVRLCYRDTQVIIAVPNISNVKRWFFPRKWGYWQVPLHITHFSKISLDRLLEDAGFVSEKWAYRNSDFLTFGSFILNLFNIDSRVSRKSKVLTSLITTLSRVHALTYFFGKNDLIVMCKPRQY